MPDHLKLVEYPCSPHCAGYLREQKLRAEIQKIVDQIDGVNDERDAVPLLLELRRVMKQQLKIELEK